MFSLDLPSPKEGRPRRLSISGWNGAASYRRIRPRQRNMLSALLFGILTCLYLIVKHGCSTERISVAPKAPRQVISSRKEHIQVKRKETCQKFLKGDFPDSHEYVDPDSDEPGFDPTAWPERTNFDESLRRLISKLPGEIHTRDYLRPVDGEGKEKLRETGLRVRAYKDFFEAWEDVHLAEDTDGDALVRDDVVQYLRGTFAKTNPDASSSSEDFDPMVTGYSLGSTIRAYEQYRSFMAKFTQLLFPWFYPFYPDLLTFKSSFARGGRGIVLTAGDGQAPYLLTTIPSFRKLGCNIPIEVMYLGDSDLNEDFQADLEALPGVVTRDIAQMVNDEGWKLKGWAAKPFAILFSSFREVIFIDADSGFFENPEVLFDDPAYKKTGALFFRDRRIMPESKKRWLQQILPQPISKNVRQSRLWTGESGHMQESGVVVVDKWRHFIALLLVTRMNGPERDKSDNNPVGIYDMVYGDKETFWIGWELAGDMTYSFHQGDTGAIGVLKSDPEHVGEEGAGNAGNTTELDQTADSDKKIHNGHDAENYTMCSPQLLHLGTDNRPLWFNGWLLESKFADSKSKRFSKFREYLIEPRDIREPGAWQLGKSNMACLTTDAYLKRDLEPKHIEMMEWLTEKSIEVGAPGYR